MAVLATAESDRFLNASLNGVTYPLPTTPMKLAVFSVIGTASAAGTEDTGGPGPYARQTIAFTTPSGGTGVSNTGIVSFLGMPAVTSVAVEIYDNNGTPRRWGFGPLAANKVTASGDTLSFAIGAITAGAT